MAAEERMQEQLRVGGRGPRRGKRGREEGLVCCEVLLCYRRRFEGHKKDGTMWEEQRTRHQQLLP
jgi:hypothetical protein